MLRQPGPMHTDLLSAVLAQHVRSLGNGRVGAAPPQHRRGPPDGARARGGPALAQLPLTRGAGAAGFTAPGTDAGGAPAAGAADYRGNTVSPEGEGLGYGLCGERVKPSQRPASSRERPATVSHMPRAPYSARESSAQAVAQSPLTARLRATG